MGGKYILWVVFKLYVVPFVDFFDHRQEDVINTFPCQGGALNVRSTSGRNLFRFGNAAGGIEVLLVAHEYSG